MVRLHLRFIIPILVPLVVLLLPASVFPFEGLTVTQQRVIAIFLFAALCWILEPIPIYSTSLLVIVLELLMLSDKGLWFMRLAEGEPHFGGLLKYTDIMATLANPIIMLFLGGFFLAMAASKYHLDLNLARVLLKPFGHNPRYVMLGLMLITGIFSMFMSNTAATAMMLAIVTPVIAVFGPKDPGRTAFVLCIPVAANIGGMGTPIGTPPNAIALKYLTGDNLITFGKWMSFAVPFVIVTMLLAWLLISSMFKTKEQRIELAISGKFLKTPKAIIVYITFAVTLLLWLLGSIHGMNSFVVAMLPVAVFSLTGIINKSDLSNISWDVLWLVSGGIALGLALDKTGLAQLVVDSIPFAQFSPYVVLVSAAFLCLLMSNFMSNTATVNLLMPLMAALGTTMTSLTVLGGGVALILVVTFAASLGMSLPISTPPNALAHATGYVQTSQMAKVGVVLGIGGMLLSFVMVWILQAIGYIG